MATLDGSQWASAVAATAALPAADTALRGQVPHERATGRDRDVLRLGVLDDLLVVALPLEADVVRRHVLQDELVTLLCIQRQPSLARQPSIPLLFDD